VLIEYVAIVYVICIFLYNIYKNNDDQIILKYAVNNCKELFEDNFKKKDINTLIALLDQQYYPTPKNE
jgi:hypothetical protein